MEEHVHKFMELLRYVYYIRDEKVKIDSLMSGFPYNYKDIIEFFNPQNLKETIKMVMHYYEQGKGKA